MTIHFGDVPANSVLPVYFTSYDANGASVTLTGLAVTDVEIYKGTSITQRASDAGITLIDTDGIDVDAVTGFHGFSIDLSDNTDAGFYAVGSFYTVLVASVTINAQTVNFIAATFRIVAAEAVAGKPKVDVDAWLGTAAATPTVAGVPEVDVTHFNGTAGTFAAGRPEVNTTHIAGAAVNTASAQLGVNVVNAAGTAWNSGAIGAATIAADAIGASELAADAVAEIADAVWDEVASGHVTVGTFGDYANFSEVLVRTTIATLASQTSFTLTAGSADNSAYNGCVIVIQDATTAAQKAVGVISGYVGATKTVTLLNDPAVFTMAATDLVTIVADRALKATVDNRTLDVSATGEAGLDWANIGSPTTAQNLSATNIDVDQVVASVSGAVGSVTGLTAATVHSDLDDIQARLPAALVGGRIDASVGAMAAGVVTAAAVATGAIDADALATDAVTEITDATKTAFGITTGTADSGTTTTMVDAALTQADTDYWKGSIIVFTSGTISGQARLITGFTPASDTVTFAPATTQAVSTETYIIIPAGRVDVNSWLGSTAAATSLPGVPEVDLTHVNGSVISNVPFSGVLNVNVTGIDPNVITAASIAADAITAAKVAADVSAEIADAVWDEDATAHQTLGTFGQAIGDPVLDATTIHGAVANRLPAALVGGRMDSNVAVMQAGIITAATIAPDAIGASELAADAVSEIAGAVWDEAMSGHVTSGTFGQRLYGIRSGTAQAGAATTITLDASASAVDDFYNNCLIVITGGTGAGQSRFITDYVGATKVATVGTWATNPGATSVFVIVPFDAIPGASAPTAAQVADAVWDEATAGHTTAGTFGEQCKTDIDAILADTGTDGVVVASLNAGSITAAAVATGAIDADALAADAANEIADALLDRAAGVETGMTMRQALRVITAALAGKLSGAATTTITIRDVNDTANRIVATVDSDGNRSAITLNLT